MTYVHNLHHVNIQTCKLAETQDFYERVLGLHVGPRPSIPRPGFWLYLRDDPILHVISIEKNDGIGEEPVNKLDHFAVMAKGMNETRATLDEMGCEYRERRGAEDHLTRFFIIDPNGVTVEMAFLTNFDTGEEEDDPPEDWYVGARFYDELPAAE